jgi:hypothetical protein
MKTLFALILVLLISAQSKSATNITTPSVSGHWTLAGSPYRVFNNVTIDSCTSLTIDPGVEVIFQGSFSLHVSGSLCATGTAAKHILFHLNDTVGWHSVLLDDGGWKGITWDAYTCGVADQSTFKYCDVADMKSDWLLKGYRSNKLEHCNFYHNMGFFYFASTSGSNFELSHSTIHDCVNKMDTTHMYGTTTIVYVGTSLIMSGISVGSTSTNSFNIHDCDIYNNFGNVPIISVFRTTFTFHHNNVYGNRVPDGYAAKGTIYMENSICSIRDNKIYDNIDAEDAPIHSNTCSTTIERNYICNNRSINGMATGICCGATQGGGGIRIACDRDSTHVKAIIRNNVIANNYAGFGGGGIYIINASVEITNNHILNNSGIRGGGIAFNNYPYSKHTRAVIQNNIIYNNINPNPVHVTDTSGHTHIEIIYDTNDVFTAYADTLIFEHNWVNKPLRRVLGLNIPADTAFILKGDTSTNIIGVNPGLIAPTLSAGDSENAFIANFNLLASSPCKDEGKKEGIKVALTDYLCNYRIYGSKIDIGAYEFGATPFPMGVTLPLALSENPMRIYPNPTTNRLSVSTKDASGTIFLVDMTGKVILQQNVYSTTTSLELIALPRNMYVVIWEYNGERTMQKVVKE